MKKEDQYTTIAGFILSLSGKIPDEKKYMTGTDSTSKF